MREKTISEGDGAHFPQEFISIIKAQLGDDYREFLTAHNEYSSKSIRLNRLKNIQIQPRWFPVPWCEGGFFIQEKKAFSHDPLFHGGAYYVQEASSMFLDYILRYIGQELSDRSLVLDLCGAPGGKTLILADAFHSDSLIISNELVPKRRLILEHNIVKWGRENILLTQSDPSKFHLLDPLFDLVLIDAPCSGEGLFRKNPAAIGQWSLEQVKHCTMRQRRILHNIISIIKPGGFLIYSTCTYNDDENMGHIKWLVQNDFESITVPLSSDWRIVKKGKGKATGYQFYPHRTKGEGFFIGVLKKKGKLERLNTSEAQVPFWKNLRQNREAGFFPISADYLDSLYTDYKNNVFYMQSHWMDVIMRLTRFIGITPLYLGSLRDQVYVPSHALALSRMLDSKAPKIPLDFESSKKFLQKENLSMTDPVPGWHIATFDDLPLGWLKGVGKRYNNYYPTRYRIRPEK